MKPLTPEVNDAFTRIPLDPKDRCTVALNDDGSKFVVDIWALGAFDGWRGYPSKAASVTFVERVAERKRIDGGKAGCLYEMAATDFTVGMLEAVWPADQIEFEDDARIVFEALKLQSIRDERIAAIQANYKINGIVPEHNLESHPDYPLAPYQQVATVCALNNVGYNLWMQQGTGKTAVSISRVNTEAREMRASGEKRVYRALVVAPKNARLNWQREFEKFSTRPGKTTILRGGELARIRGIYDAFIGLKPEDEFTVVIMSYEAMCRSIDAIKTIQWDLAILDEAHYIKWPETQRSKISRVLRECCRQRMGLTGTPVCNNALDVFSQLEYLEQGRSGFINWRNFRSFYGVFETTGGGHERLISVQNLPFMRDRIARSSFIITKKEALPYLPEKTYDLIEVEMGARQQEIYNEVRDKLAIEIESDLANASDEGRSLTIQNILTKLLRLAQITSGFIKWDPVVDVDGTVLRKGFIEYFNPNAKLDALVEELKEKGPNDKTLVWACWIPDLEAIHERLEAEGIDHVMFYGGVSDADRQEAEYRFNHDPNCKVFVANPASGGTALNLLGYPPGRADEYETNCNHEVYYSQGWSSVQRSQSEDRAHRMGTRDNIRISDLCVPLTIDEEIRTRVMRKRISAYELTDIYDILRNILGMGAPTV